MKYLTPMVRLGVKLRLLSDRNLCIFVSFSSACGASVPRATVGIYILRVSDKLLSTAFTPLRGSRYGIGRAS